MAIFDPKDIQNGEELSRKLDEILKKTKEQEVLERSLGESVRSKIKSQKQLNRELKVAKAASTKLNGTIKERQESYRDLSTEEKKSADSFVREMKKSSESVNEFKDYINDLEKGIKRLGRYGSKELEKISKYSEGPKIRDALGGRLRGISRSMIGTGFSGVGKGIKMGRGSASRMGLGLMEMGEKSKGMGGIKGALGGAASSAGSFITKFVPIIGALGGAAGAAVGAVKAIISLDGFLKNLNKRFLEMAGPTVGMNALNQMKKFNDTIFDVDRNMRLGLQAEDIQKMFGAMAAQGMSLQGVQSSAGEYSTAIEDARRLSLQFGVSLESMAGDMSDQMLNLRSSLEEVRDSFDTMSYSAQKAGVTGEKFYQGVQAATSSLSFYGNYLKYASGLLEDFVSKGVAGFKDATDATTELMGVGKDPQRNRRLVALLKDQAKDLVEGMTAVYDDKIRLVDKKLKGAREALANKGGMSKESIEAAEGEIARLSKERNKLMSQRAIPKYAADTGDFQAMSEALTQTERPLELLSAYLKKMKLDLFGKDGIAVFELFTKELGLSSKTILEMKSAIGGMADTAIEFYEANSEGLKNLKENNSEVFGSLDDKLTSLASGEKGFQEVGEEINFLIDSLKGVTPEFKRQLKDLSEKAPQLASEIIGNNYAGQTKIQRENTIRRGAQQSFLGSKAAGEFLGNTDEQTNALIEATTPIQKQLDITKDGIKYALAGNDMMKNVATHTYAIAQKAKAIFDLLNKKARDVEEKKFNTYKTSNEMGALSNAILAQSQLGEKISSAKKSEFLKGFSDTVLKKMVGMTPKEQLNKLKDINNRDITEDEAFIFKGLMDQMKEKENIDKYINDQRTKIDQQYFQAATDQAAEMKNNTEVVKTLNKTMVDFRFFTSDKGSNFSRKIEKVLKKMKPKEKESFRESLNTAIDGTSGSDEKKQAIAEVYKALDPYTRRYLTPLLDQMNEKTDDFSAVNTILHNLYDRFNIPTPAPQIQAKKDFSFGSSGWVHGSPGDLLIDKKSMANGMGAGIGGLADMAINKMGAGSRGGVENNWGGITINMDGGDASSVKSAIPELKRALDSFVDQKFKRLMLEHGTKV